MTKPLWVAVIAICLGSAPGLAATKTGQAIARKVLIRDIEVLPDEENP